MKLFSFLSTLLSAFKFTTWKIYLYIFISIYKKRFKSICASFKHAYVCFHFTYWVILLIVYQTLKSSLHRY